MILLCIIMASSTKFLTVPASTRARSNSSAKCASRSRLSRGSRSAYDYEYRRNGTVNLFVALDVHRPWRKVTLIKRRTATDFAEQMRISSTAKIRGVLDNLSTHTPGSLYEALPAPSHPQPAGVPLHAEARQLAYMRKVKTERVCQGNIFSRPRFGCADPMV